MEVYRVFYEQHVENALAWLDGNPIRVLASAMKTASMAEWFEVHDLFVRYTTSLDACDVEAVVDCFAPDGWLESPVLGRFEGHAGIREFVGRTIKVRDERGGQFRHVISNLRVADRWRSRRGEVLSPRLPDRRRQDRAAVARRVRVRPRAHRGRLALREPPGAHGPGVLAAGSAMSAEVPITGGIEPRTRATARAASLPRSRRRCRPRGAVSIGC